MKILHIIATLGRGGAEAALYRLVTNSNNHEHHVVCLSKEEYYGTQLLSEGFKVDNLDMPNGRISLRGVRRLISIVREDDIDVVQTWMYHSDLLGGVLCRVLTSLPVIWGIRVTNVKNVRYSLSSRVVFELCRRLSIVIPHHIISCASTAKVEHVQVGYPEKKISVVANGYDIQALKGEPELATLVRRELGVEPSTFLIGVVARWHAQKNHRLLFDALKTVARSGMNFTVVLVGTYMNKENRELSDLISESGLNDHIVLVGESDNVQRYYCAMDVHVLPSLDEGFPNVLAEAMLCGTPCIATDVGDASIILNNSGWIIPSNDSAALTSAIFDAHRIFNDKQAWLTKTTLCRNVISERFSIEVMVKGFERIWETQLKMKRSSE